MHFKITKSTLRMMITVATVILLTFLTSACTADTVGDWIFNDTPTEINNGFSPELLNTLSERYQISIPDDAKFIKGLNTNSFRDPTVVVLFECDVESEMVSTDDNGCCYVFELLKLDDSRYTFGGFDEGIVPNFYKDMGGKLDYKIDDKNDPFTYISYSFENEKLLLRFTGSHPGATFE